MLREKIVEQLHMSRLMAGFEMMVPVVQQMREAGLSTIEIASVLRGLASHLTEDQQPESDDTAA
jgi:hypothetical protein